MLFSVNFRDVTWDRLLLSTDSQTRRTWEIFSMNPSYFKTEIFAKKNELLVFLIGKRLNNGIKRNENVYE